MIRTKNSPNVEKGFTLVELAIVMIIIGLLIGGILKGQELIVNARVAATITQIKGIDSATSTFQEKYNALPGDMALPTTRLANCNGDCAVGDVPATNGDGKVQNGAVESFTAAPATETLAFFPQLAAAAIISGVNPALGAVWGGDFPAASIGGGFQVGYYAGGVAPQFGLINAAIPVRAGHYLALHNAPNGGVGRTMATGTDITPNQAFRIDAKLDDGNPLTGSIFPAGGNGAGALVCVNVNVYNETFDTNVCNLYIRFH